MPYKSKAQAAYFNAHRKELEAQGVDVARWNEESRGRVPQVEHVDDKKKQKTKAAMRGALVAKHAANALLAERATPPSRPMSALEELARRVAYNEAPGLERQKLLPTGVPQRGYDSELGYWQARARQPNAPPGTFGNLVAVYEAHRRMAEEVAKMVPPEGPPSKWSTEDVLRVAGSMRPEQRGSELGQSVGREAVKRIHEAQKQRDLAAREAYSAGIRAPVNLRNQGSVWQCGLNCRRHCRGEQRHPSANAGGLECRNY